jgi:hypothetical protein
MLAVLANIGNLEFRLIELFGFEKVNESSASQKVACF